MNHSRIHAARIALGVTAVVLALAVSDCAGGKTAWSASIWAFSSLGDFGGLPLARHHGAHPRLAQVRALLQLPDRL